MNSISLSPIYKSYVYAATGGGDKPFSNPDYNVSLSTSDSYTKNASLIGISSSSTSTVTAGDTDYSVAGIGINLTTYQIITYQNSSAGAHKLSGNFDVGKNSLVLLVSTGTNEASPVISAPFSYSFNSSPLADMGILYAYSILKAGVYNFSLSYTLWGNSTDYAASIAAAIYIFNTSLTPHSTSYSEILTNSNITTLSVDSENTYFATSARNSNGTSTLYYFNSNGRLIWDSVVNGAIVQISLSSNGSYVGASYGNVLLLFNGSGEMLWSRVINGPVSGSYIDTVSVSENGNYIAAGMIGPSGEPYGAIYLFSNSNHLLWNYTKGTSSYLGVHTVQISSNDEYVIMTAGNGFANGGYLALFDINGSIVWDKTTSLDPNNAFFTENNSYIVSTAWDSYVDGGVNGLLFYGLNGTLLWQSTLGLNHGPAPAATSNGNGYIGVGSNGNLTYFSSSGKELWDTNLVSSQSIPFLVSMTGGSNIIASSYNSTLNIFDSNGTEISGFTFTHLVTSIQLFSLGSKMLVGTEDGLYIGILNTTIQHTGSTSNINIKAFNSFNNTFSQNFSIIMSNQSMNLTVLYNATNGNATLTGVPYGNWSLVGIETAYGTRLTNVSLIQVSSPSLNLTLNMTAPAPKSLSLTLTSLTSNVIYGPSNVFIYASVNGYVGNYSSITYYINNMSLVTYLEMKGAVGYLNYLGLTEGHLVEIPFTDDGTYSIFAEASSGGYYFGKYYKTEMTDSNTLTFHIEPNVYEATMTDVVPSNITFTYNSEPAALINFNNGNADLTTQLTDNANVFSFPDWAQQIFGLMNPVYQLAYGSQGNLELKFVYNEGSINLTNFDIGRYTPLTLNNTELTFYLVPSTLCDAGIDLGLMALSAFASLHIGTIVDIILPMVISTITPIISSFITSSSTLTSLITHIPGILMSLVHVIPTMWPEILKELSKEFTGNIANELTAAADTIDSTFAGILSDIFVFEKVAVLVADAASLIYSIINGPIRQNVVVSNLHPDTVATIKGDTPYSNVSYKNYYASYNGAFSSNNGYISHSVVINDTYSYLIPTNEFNVSISAPRNVSSENYILNVQYLNEAASQAGVATSSPTSFSVHANDTAITFTPVNKSSPPSGISNTALYIIIGIVVAVAAIGSMLAIIRKKR